MMANSALRIDMHSIARLNTFSAQFFDFAFLLGFGFDNAVAFQDLAVITTFMIAIVHDRTQRDALVDSKGEHKFFLAKFLTMGRFAKPSFYQASTCCFVFGLDSRSNGLEGGIAHAITSSEKSGRQVFCERTCRFSTIPPPPMLFEKESRHLSNT